MIWPSVSGSGVEKAQLVARLRATGEPAEKAVRVRHDARGSVRIDVGSPSTAPYCRWMTTGRPEKLAEVAAEFDRIRSIQRAVEVGLVDAITSVAQLRPSIIDTIERWLRR